MKKVHWGGGLKITGKRITKMLAGWPCCCSGRRAEKIREEGNLELHHVSLVTCKACINLLRKAGRLEEGEGSPRALQDAR